MDIMVSVCTSLHPNTVEGDDTSPTSAEVGGGRAPQKPYFLNIEGTRTKMRRVEGGFATQHIVADQNNGHLLKQDRERGGSKSYHVHAVED